MSRLEISQLSGRNISASKYGGKAAGLSLLYRYGANVPDALFIEATADAQMIDDPGFQAELTEAIKPFRTNDTYDLAIRSSSTAEDAYSESLAGHYLTIIGHRMAFSEVIDKIKTVIGSLQKVKIDDRTRMGVILQKRIDAEYSGVLFSSDPFTYSKNTAIISTIKGLGEALVSGESEGEDILVDFDGDDFKIIEGHPVISHDLIAILLRDAKRIEKAENYPLDIEWAVKDGELFFLQCRPLASITKIPSMTRFVDKHSLSDIPSALVSHDKIKLRFAARQSGILISDAYVYIHNSCNTTCDAAIDIKKSDKCKGYSAVIIYPKTLSDKVIRSFVGDKTKIKGSIKDCCRYGFRSFPEYDNLDNCLCEYSKVVSSDYWISATILQEIYDPLYTGIIKHIPDGFVIEITKGHFLTKGVVPTSQYSITADGRITTKKETHQNSWYKIIEGHVIYCVCNEGEDDLVYLTDEEAAFLQKYLMRSIQNETTVIEFGILANRKEGLFQPYLIDFVDDSTTGDIESTDLADGIISKGVATGMITYIEDQSHGSLDAHFHDALPSDTECDDKVIFFCERPDISLLEVIRRYRSENIGFVFEDGSLLCHLAVVLREKGIPAIKIGEPFAKSKSGICTIDASSIGISGKERISYE